MIRRYTIVLGLLLCSLVIQAQNLEQTEKWLSTYGAKLVKTTAPKGEWTAWWKIGTTDTQLIWKEYITGKGGTMEWIDYSMDLDKLVEMYVIQSSNLEYEIGIYYHHKYGSTFNNKYDKPVTNRVRFETKKDALRVYNAHVRLFELLDLDVTHEDATELENTF